MKARTEEGLNGEKFSFLPMPGNSDNLRLLTTDDEYLDKRFE